jgi:hypothetical protein
MAKSSSHRKILAAHLPVLPPDLQIAFYTRLQAMRGLYLYDALSATVNKLNIPTIDKELAKFVEAKSLKKLAKFGLRGEVIFPVPCVLQCTPQLLGYYRLLCGHSQKEFYSKGPFGAFKTLEENGKIPAGLHLKITDLCLSLITTGQLLLDGLDKFTLPIANDLQLLTLGPQFRGSRNTSLGQTATKAVFELIKNIAGKYVTRSDARSISVLNDASRGVSIAFSSDPDIAISEQLRSGVRPLVSIEIKGGTDYSNIHNRIGEAEKSHQKARSRGFFEFWTIIAVPLEYSQAKAESPTTSHFFQLAKIADKDDLENQKFRELLGSILSIRTT